MPSNQAKRSSALSANWLNRSSSSVNTFHSAATNMELSQLCAPSPQPSSYTPHPEPEQQTSSKNPSSLVEHDRVPSPKLEAVKMGRQDSGFSDGIRSSNSSRPTSSSSARVGRSKRSSTGSRSSTKRAPRSSHKGTQHRSSIPHQRPQVRTRHTIPSTQATPHQFFHFPTLHDPPQNSEPETPPPPPLPVTVNYWTSDSTRRLEYAAIDAANHGVRGFFIKLVPDCILSPTARRTKFHDETDSDAGSVRRYRLALPEEKPCSEGGSDEARGSKRPGIFRRWTSLGFGRRSS